MTNNKIFIFEINFKKVMEHNIGIGVIIGLLTASSIYVWQSKNFTKTQKTILLICIVFAPLQWLGIIVFSIYNKIQLENTPERIAEKKTEEVKSKLNSTIENLKDLKQKGILSEEEFNTKVDKIEAEKSEQNLKNSTEYKQLKNLLDSGILTKEEFENKSSMLLEKEEVFNPPIKYDIKFIDNHHSFTNGNFKAWLITWENGSNQKFFVKNSNGRHFIESKNETLFFKDKNEFLKHSYNNSINNN